MTNIIKDFRDYAPPESGYKIVNGKVLVLDKDRNIIYGYDINELKGGSESVLQWDNSTTYPIDFIVEYNLKLWKSKINDNLNNPPVEGSNWTEVTKSEANGFGRYTVGVYTINPTLVVNGNSLYLLNESEPLPFESTDFTAELSAGIWVDVNGVNFDDQLQLRDPSLATPSGVPTEQKSANEEYTANIQAILAELARLASASGAIQGSPLPIPVTTTETQLDFTTTSPSTDTDIIDIDDVSNSFSLKTPGRYTWLTSLEVENTSQNTDHTLTIRTRKVSDDTILTSRDISVPERTVRTDFRAVFYDILDGEEPVGLYISLESSSNSSIILNKFETTLSYGGSGSGQNTDEFVKTSINDTTAGYLSIKSLFGTEFESVIQNPSGNESLLTTFKGWIFNATRSFKHILVSNATADRTQQLQDKDGTIALLSDVNTGNITCKSLLPDTVSLSRQYNWKISILNQTGGIFSFTNSAGSPHTPGDTVTAGDYLDVSCDTVGATMNYLIEAV